MTFDPTTLTGKRLWLRAKDNSSGSVSTWTDQSGTSHNGTSNGTAPTVAAASTPGGGKSVAFSSGYYSFSGLGPLLGGSQFKASSVYEPGVEAWRAFDGNAATFWASLGTAPQWLRVDGDAATVATSYGITPRTGFLTQAPTAFTFEGSNDGSTWTTLDTRSGISWPTATKQTFTFSNSTPYSKYRLTCTASSTGYISLTELEVPGLVFAAPGAEMWIVVKSNLANVTSWAFGNPANGGSAYPYAGTVYEDFATDDRLTFTPSPAVNSWRLYRVVRTGTQLKAYLDQTLQGTLTAASYEPATTTLGGKSGSNFSGNIAEVLIRDRVSSADEISWLIYYFNTEHGLSVPGGVDPSIAATTVAAPVSVGAGFAASTVLTTTVAAPVSVGAGFSAKTVLASTLGLAASVGLAFSGSAIASTTLDAPVSVGLSIAAETVEAGTTTLAMPATIGASFVAGTAVTTTLDAPATVGLSFAATKLEPTTLALPVTVGLGFSAFLGGGTTLSMPVQTELTFSAHGGDTIALPTTTDPTVLPFVTSGHATSAPPLPATPPGIIERPIMRRSVIVPDLRTIPGVVIDDANQPHLTDAIYDALPVVESEVGVPHLVARNPTSHIYYTYLRGKRTKLLTDRREEPFGDATFSFELPGMSSMDAWPVEEDDPLFFLINRANMQIELVKSDGTRRIAWTGHIVSHDTGNNESSPTKVVQCVGTMFQASTDRMKPPPFLDPTDIGTLMSKALNNYVTSRRYPTMSAPATGILSRQRGSWADSPLAYVQGLLATAWTNDGRQWTVAKVEGSTRTYEIRLKKTAPEWTVTNGARGVSVELTRDGASVRNVIYGHGVGPDGNAWFNYHYPNLHADTAPAYPFSSPGSVITVGTTDASTTSGKGVSDWQRRAVQLGYKLAVDGVFNASDATVARTVQRRFGVSIDGVVGPQTWNATFGVGSNSGDLSSVIRLPLAADPQTQRYLYNADGSIAGPNPDFEVNVLTYADDVDFGAGITRAEGIASAQQIVDREKAPGLTGRITLTQDPREDSRFLIPPGDKITLIGYEGADRVLHITAVERNWQTGEVTLEVDEKSRDAMTVAEIASRNKEARRDPARRPGNPNKRSRLDTDQVVPFDGESGAGVIPRLALYGGLWSVIRIPVSETGRVAKMHLEAGAPFAIAFFGAPITPAHLVSYVGNPLASDSPFQPHEKELDKFWFIEGFGQKGQRCGYYPGSESESTGFTGVEEQGGFEYTSSRPPWVWVAMYAASSCFLEGTIYPDTVV